MTQTNVSLLKESGFKLKGGMYTLTTLQLLDFDLDIFAEQLAIKVKQAPKFFDHTPVVIDIQALKTRQGNLEFDKLVKKLIEYTLIPVGIRGGNELQNQAALQAGLAILADDKSNKENELSISKQTNTQSPTKVIHQPVRSGQQIYVPGGDLIVMAAVSAGAEVLADGHIHIYGPLRGRALAGVHGDHNAMICCQSLEAELVSVAGQYRMSESLKDPLWKKPAVISLVEGHLQVQSM
jgi:septum site-determining protein MinC